MTPSELVYGQNTLSLISYLLGGSKFYGIENTLHHADILFTRKYILVMAQNKMKQQEEYHHYEHSFEVWDHVFLHLHPYKCTSHKAKFHHKLGTNFYGIYYIIQHIGQATYKLALLVHYKFHQIFHVSCLKKVMGQNGHVQTTLM